ncbi:hypothetical protein [Thermosulfuriphilus sp.]
MMELFDKTFLDEISEKEVSEEIAQTEEALATKRAQAQETETEMMELVRHLKFKPEAIEAEVQKEKEFAAAKVQEAEDTFQLRGQEDICLETVGEEVLDQLVLESNLVGGGAPGHYLDVTPYHFWCKVYPHNEGGVTRGSCSGDRAARKMFLYAQAQGDGLGWTDDNDVTTYGKFFYAFWPRKIGSVRVLVPVVTRGWYRIRSNDKWWNSKEAAVDLRISVRLFQNYWGPKVERQLFRQADDNINESGRIDLYQALYSASMAVGANKWVIVEVSLRLRVETEGSGSLAILSFRHPDCIFIPSVRFDFA